MATFEVPNEYLAVAPLVVTSPTTRCGTTLLQRLICASDNAFIYGEEIGRQLNSLTDQFLTVIRYAELNQQSLGDSFQQAMDGALGDWRPGLAPPAEIMVKAWMQTYYQLPIALAGFGRTIGRPIWGFKWPGCPAASLRALMMLMPLTRAIYLVRHPAAALQSAKARKFVKSPQETDAFCQGWASNVESALALGEDPRLLVMRYEDLLADKGPSLARVESFAGVRGLRLDAFAVKLNTFVGDEADGHSPTQYIEPAALTPADLDAIERHAGPMIRRLYPEGP